MSFPSWQIGSRGSSTMPPIGGSCVSLGYAAAGADDLPVLAVRPHVHLPDRLRKHLVDVHPILGAGLDERAAPDLGEGHALHGGHLALALQVHLVADEEDGHPLSALHPHYLVPHCLDVLALE